MAGHARLETITVSRLGLCIRKRLLYRERSESGAHPKKGIESGKNENAERARVGGSASERRFAVENWRKICGRYLEREFRFLVNCFDPRVEL